MTAVWHGHHNRLISYIQSVEARVADIKAYKAENEQETRLRLMKPVVGELPAGLLALMAEGYALWAKGDADYRAEIEALHAVECGCKEWDGMQIVFPGGGFEHHAHADGCVFDNKADAAVHKAADAALVTALTYKAEEPGLRERIEALEAWSVSPTEEGCMITGPTTPKVWIRRDDVLAALAHPAGEGGE